MNVRSKIIIGSAQFGLNYGVSNNTGKVPASEAHKILKLALSNEINRIDTAISYGNAEEVIGSFNEVKKLSIITKIPKISSSDYHKEIKYRIEESINRLKSKSVYAIMLHDEDDIFNFPEVIKELIKLKEKGFIQKIGASFYTPEKFDTAMKNFDIDIAQVPLSIFDQSFIQKNTIETAQKKNVEVHCRSIFLQGLAFLKKDSIPTYFKPVMKRLNEFHSYITKNNLSPTDLCYQFLKSLQGIDGYVIGVQNSEQLKSSLEAEKKSIFTNIDYSRFDLQKKEFQKPNLWTL